jgi:heme/copper-type cytochrome/quinol oxidase subunit 4
MDPNAPTAGGLHTGNTVPATTGDAPGTLHTGAGAPPAKRGGMFGGRKGHEGTMAGGGGRGDGFAVNAGARIGLAISQLLTAIAFLVVLGGLSSLQSRANSLTLLPAQQALYAETFQSGNQVPYPGDGHRQFALQWWILMFEVFIFTMIMILLVMPRHLLRLKHAAMAFLVYVFVLTTLQVNSLFYFNRSPVSRALFGSHRIRATLAGSLMGAICNAFSIIFLGLLRDARDDHHRGIGGKRVGHDATGPAAV